MDAIVLNGDAIPSPIRSRLYIVTNRRREATDPRVIQQGLDVLACLAIEFFVGVQYQNPVRVDRLKRRVASLCVVILPGEGHDGSPEFVRDRTGLVRGAGVGNDNLADDVADALQAGANRVRFVLHDHGETDSRQR